MNCSQSKVEPTQPLINLFLTQYTKFYGDITKLNSNSAYSQKGKNKKKSFFFPVSTKNRAYSVGCNEEMRVRRT